MNTEYYIIDDIIPQSLFNKIENVLTDFNLQSWYMVPTTATDKNIKEKTNNLNYSFAQWLFNDNRPQSQFHEVAHDGILTALDKFGIEYSEYYRTRLNLFMPQTENIIHGVHIDRVHPHHSMIIYMNDSDGDTYLYEEHEQWMKHELNVPEHKNLTVAARIKPKRNRAVLFCGNRYHSSSAPIESDYRMTLNTNFLVKDYNYGVQNTWQ